MRLRISESSLCDDDKSATIAASHGWTNATAEPTTSVSEIPKIASSLLRNGAL